MKLRELSKIPPGRGPEEKVEGHETTSKNFVGIWKHLKMIGHETFLWVAAHARLTTML